MAAAIGGGGSVALLRRRPVASSDRLAGTRKWLGDLNRLPVFRHIFRLNEQRVETPGGFSHRAFVAQQPIHPVPEALDLVTPALDRSGHMSGREPFGYRRPVQHEESVPSTLPATIRPGQMRSPRSVSLSSALAYLPSLLIVRANIAHIMTGTTIDSDAFVLGGWKERQRREGKNLNPLVSEVFAGSLLSGT